MPKSAHWRKLDNAAKLYSATSNKKDTRVFRFYCILKEEVNPVKLQEALDRTLLVYPVFLSVMRKGLFWHYLEHSDLPPYVVKEHREPCSTLYIRDKKTLLFEVTYFKNRINFEVFHALTDGTGATEFLRELVKNYLYLSHTSEGLPDLSLKDPDITLQDQENDSFSKYYTKRKAPRMKKPGAIQIKSLQRETNGLNIDERILSVTSILTRSRKLGVSMTVFLTAVYMMAIHQEMTRHQEKDPVVLMVPVNLRKFFSSNSMLNFFNWIEPGYHFENGEETFEDVLDSVKDYFKSELTKEQVSRHMSELVALEMHPVLKLAPLELKNLCIRAGAYYAEKYVTAIFSNMGAIHMPEEYASYIERFGVFTNTPKMELCMCSFEDKLSLGFTSRYDTENIICNFYRILEEQGIHAEKSKPEYPKPDVPRKVKVKIFRLYSFLCLAAILAFTALNFMFHPKTHWSLFTAAGIGSMWLATWIGVSKRYNLMKNLTWQLILVSAGSVLWDLSTGWHGWSVDFMLPAVCMSVSLSLLIIAKIQGQSAREYMIYFVMSELYGIILPLILLVSGVTKFRILSIACIVVCIVILLALLIFRWREFQEEMQKKFHI